MARERAVGGRLGLGVAAVALAGGAALVTAGTSLDAWFTGDDLGEIQRAEHGDPRGAHVRPLVAALLRANLALGDLDPRGYHLLNVVLHAGVIVLVGWAAAGLVRLWGLPEERARWVPWVAAAAFAAGASHSEAVSWISARGDVVVGGCGMVAVGAWVRRGEGRGWRAAAVAATVVGLAAKEHAVALPVLCVVAGLGPGRPSRARVRAALRDAWPLGVVLGAYLVLRAVAIGSVVGSYEGSGAFRWSPVVVGGRLVTMAVRTLVPGTERWLLGVLTAALAALVALWWWRLARRAEGRPDRGLLVTTAVLVVVALLPGAGLGVSLTDVRGDRLLYLASTFAGIGLAVVLVGLVRSLPAGFARGCAVAVGACALVLSTRAAVERDARWAEAGDLAEATVASGPVWERRRPAVVVNPIDTVRGAYAHRNALGEAAEAVHGWPPPDYVHGLAPMAVSDASAEVVVEAIGPGRWRLVPDPRTARFDPSAPPPDRYPGVSVEHLEDGGVEVRVDPDVGPDEVWVVTGGELVPLGEVG